jgi:alpha-tubulin suppressor-like RCC1 family protein
VAAPFQVLGADGGVPAVSIAAGTSHTCAARGDGHVSCWGDDSKGQLGDDGAATGTCASGPCATVPVTMATITDGVSVACGADFSCVIRHNDFSEWCAGNGALGQLGNGGASGSPVPVQLASVGGLGELSSPQAGGGHACAQIATNASLWCWGDNARGQLFTSTPTQEASPTPVGAIADVVQVALGADFSCVMTTGAVVRCVGANDQGQLGLSSTDPNPHPTPAPVIGLP